MTRYHSNVRDMLFDLLELLDRGSTYGQGPFAETDAAATAAVLEEADRYARDKLAGTFSDAGWAPVAFDPELRSVSLPEAYRAAAVDYLTSGWPDLDYPASGPGDAVPPSLRWCVNELMLGANPAIPQGVNVVPQVTSLLESAGTPAQQRLAGLIRARHWMVTMVLTEPEAGSDVGSARTRAAPQPDGSWHIEGIKRFISYGDHDMSDNIIHAVLARPVGVAGAGGPGTKGLSLFVVPKYHVDLESGELGARNGVEVTGLERKMGLKGSPTCEVTFGRDRPAAGWLLGEKHAGIGQMFEIIKHIRMLVGVKSLAALSAGYLSARDFAQARVQGPRLVARPGDHGSVPIIEHPDVRRSLMTQKAYAEGMRAMVLYVGACQDQLLVARAAGSADLAADRRHQLLLPVIKAYCSETACQQLSQETLQTFGGSGYMQDYPVEQYLRDTKVDTLYEGTTAIQGLDLLSRKIVRDQGAALRDLLDEVSSTGPSASLGTEFALLADAVTALGAFAQLLTDRWNAGGRDRETAAQDSTRLLMRLGDLLCGWLLLRSALIADRALASAATTVKDRDFYSGKAAAGRWFARRILPGISSDLTSARAAWNDLAAVPASAF
ncbi:MAG: acyl-CoA dehydrogenase [Trebonia sp.]